MTIKSLQGKEFEEWKKTNEGHYINNSLKEEYNNRLLYKPKANGHFHSFKDQFDNGNGQELNKKFWSKVSSSRMAFDLYSWIDSDNNCVEIQFEKKLPAIKS